MEIIFVRSLEEISFSFSISKHLNQSGEKWKGEKKFAFVTMSPVPEWAKFSVDILKIRLLCGK